MRINGCYFSSIRLPSEVATADASSPLTGTYNKIAKTRGVWIPVSCEISPVYNVCRKGNLREEILMNKTHIGSFVLLAFALIAIEQARTAEGNRGVDPQKAKATADNPLAGLPSTPGAHLEKIKTLGDNQWLNLGSPAPDPKWGKGYGRSWCPHMPYVPERKVAMLYG